MAEPPAEPSLDDEERRALVKGIAEFNAGLFFECHDTLEDMWGGIRGPSRDFFQGLIQESVGFYHLTGGNAPGAASMLERASKRLQAYPDRYFGFDLAAHRRELAGWLDRIRTGEAPPVTLEALPKWRFEAPGDHPG